MTAGSGVTIDDVDIDSGGVRLAGWLHRPAGAGDRLPLVVMCQGFGGLAARLRMQAHTLAEAGVATLTFDYRSFGRSGGVPRHVVDLAGQRADLRAAIVAGSALPGVDPSRVAVWGVSLGGAHAVRVAADGAPVAAVIAQVPFNGFPRRVEGRNRWTTARLFAAIVRDRLGRRLGAAPHYVPLVGRPGEVAIVTTPEAVRHVTDLGPEVERVDQVAPGAALDMLRYRPGDVADRVPVPVLVCAAEFDTETPLPLVRRIADRAPYGELRVFPATHLEFYDDPQLWARVARTQVEFLRRTVAAEVPGRGPG